jgi:hypothetical protein
MKDESEATRHVHWSPANGISAHPITLWDRRPPMLLCAIFRAMLRGHLGKDRSGVILRIARTHFGGLHFRQLNSTWNSQPLPPAQ